jgi:hypothetical protein
MPSHSQRAFVLAEALTAAFILIVIAAVLVVLGAKHRATTGLNRDLGNLRQIGQWTHAYAADFEDRAPALDEAPDTTFPILQPVPGEDLRNAVKHAMDILWRRTGRNSGPDRIEIPTSWFPNLLYTHLVIADYADLSFPDRDFVSTGDVHRMKWTDDPIGKHDQGFWQPYQEPQNGSAPSFVDRRWPYSSSYQIGPAWYDAGQSDWSPGVSRIHPLRYASVTVPPSTVIEGQRTSSVAFPSQKVMWHDYGDWYHASRPYYFAAAGSEGDPRVAIAAGDGAATVRATADANPGWHPVRPTTTDTARFVYDPRDWEPPTTNGAVAEAIFAGYYRWTRGGLKGRDFDGTEINTGQR